MTQHMGLHHPFAERLARAWCAVRGENPDAKVLGVTGREWLVWQQVAIHTLPKLVDEMEARGLCVMEANNG
jgi:hypothetical protein